MGNLVIAVVEAAGFSVVLAVVEITSRSEVRRAKYAVRASGFAAYACIVCVGNVATTIAAASLVSRSLPTLPFPWFWYAFIGVFGFEAVLQNLNVTLFDRGVLSVADWIDRSRAIAVAGAVDLEANDRFVRSVALAELLRSLPEATLRAHVLTHLGKQRLDALLESFPSSGVQPQFGLALALVNEAFEKSFAIATVMDGSETQTARARLEV